jgi:hypothetical protein
MGSEPEKIENPRSRLTAMLSFILLALLWIVPLSALMGFLNSLVSRRHRLLSRDWWLADVKEMTGVYAVLFLVGLVIFVIMKSIGLHLHESPQLP